MYVAYFVVTFCLYAVIVNSDKPQQRKTCQVLLCSYFTFRFIFSTHVLRKDDSYWVKKCVDFVVEDVEVPYTIENMEGSS